MPKVELGNKGLIQTSGHGLQIDLPVNLNGKGVSGVAYSSATTLTRTGAGSMGAITVALPKNALITDVGMVLTTGITINTGNVDVTVKVGDGAGEDDICAAANLISANNASATGTAISVSGANSEGAAALAFAASAPMYTAAARSIHFTVTNVSTGTPRNITAGVGVCFVSYVVA